MSGRATVYLVAAVWLAGAPLAARWPAVAAVAVLATFALVRAWNPARGGDGR